jgi:hypothetical protein
MALNAKSNPTYSPKRINGKFAPGCSGNPGGSLEATRRSFNKDFLLALAADFKQHGASAIARVRKQQPATYVKVCALLVPREMRLEYNQSVKAMSDQELEAAIEVVKAMLEQRAGEAAKVITAETVALPAPDVVLDGPNKVMDAANTAVGARERKPGKDGVPSPAGT